jgi:hypothetical protein
MRVKPEPGTLYANGFLQLSGATAVPAVPKRRESLHFAWLTQPWHEFFANVNHRTLPPPGPPVLGYE